MTNCLFEAYVTMMPAIRAERMLDAAQVASYPLYLQHAAEQAKSWWQRLVDDTQTTLRQMVAGREQDGQRGPRFTFNGQGVSISALKERLAGALGRGLSA
jgi:hypothetical protein